MVKTANELIAFVLCFIGCPYWYGTFGNIATPEFWKQKEMQYPTQYTAARKEKAKKQYGKRVFDCCGLIKAAFMMKDAKSNPKYNAVYDKNVAGLFKACKRTGNIKYMPEVAGLLVFRNNAHVGVYIGGGYVVEAKGFDYGVVKTKLKDGKWTKYGYLSWVQYEEEINIDLFNKPKKYINKYGSNLFIFADKNRTNSICSMPAGAAAQCLGTVETNGTLCCIILYDDYIGFTTHKSGLSK